MAIIQISKIQQRAGNLVDLPQLDNAEFGWATDENQLFIGRTGNTVTNENIEVLTSYSNISFSQITGSDGGNFNITSSENGQILTYISTTNTWENYPSTDIISANANFKLNLGNVEHLNINGGSIGYVLETDGSGNLSWAPKGTLYTDIKAISAADPMVMTVANTTPYTNNAVVTISGVLGTGNSIVNGKAFYIQLATNFSTTGNVSLYNSAGNGSPASGAGLTATANTGIATSLTGGTGGGAGGQAGGVNTQVQYNDSTILAGNADFTYNNTTKLLTLNGNVNCANLNASATVVSPVLVSNIAIGTAPLTVTSTTRVANLSVAYANVSDYGVTTTQTTGTFYPTFVNANTSGNLALSSNANLSFNAATGRLSATLLGGTLTTAAQSNITTVGTLGALAVTGNITSGNANLGNAVSANFFLGNGSQLTGIIATTSTALANGTSNVTIPSVNSNIAMFVGGNATAQLTVTASGANIPGTFGVSGNANVGNLGTSGKVIASVLESNVTTGTAPLTIASTTRVTNLNVAYANVSDYNAMIALTTGTMYPTFISGTGAANYALGSNTAYSANIANGSFTATTFVGNLSGAATSATTAGTVTTAAQPNITSVGTLTSLSVSGTATVGNLSTTDITTGSNTTQGNLTGNWVLTTGSRLQATYADLAEYYEADKKYEPGTVLEFGGEKEVTLAEDGTSRVAGVVSTDPAYAMNMKCPGLAVAVALQGRVPTKVRGTINKGDMMVSGGNGFARPSSAPHMGTVIGKALENFDGIEGVIEIAVGRL
jgi:hypothetical protein